ncbi:MAG TPA: extracellular solute-binding protein, partial [Chloroflexota bacterium]|nr:extracellular solute-binding protein [Chloroflexota bacterium]
MNTPTLGMTRRRVVGGGMASAAGGLLAACGAASSAPPAKAAAVSGAIELMWSNEQSTLDFLNADWIPNFKRENPQSDVTLNVVPGSWDDLFQKIQVSSASGTPPTLSRGKDYFTGDMAALGLTEPLDKYL